MLPCLQAGVVSICKAVGVVVTFANFAFEATWNKWDLETLINWTDLDDMRRASVFVLQQPLGKHDLLSINK